MASSISAIATATNIREPCPVGERFKATIKLNDFARTIPKGHRLRLAIQTQFWFVLWPQPDLATVTLKSGTSRLRLPVRPPSPLDRESPV